MSSYDLGGHSGCQIFLIDNDDGRVFVRKISKDVDYNARLETQSVKQASFKGAIVRAPKVLETGYMADGRFFFDMEYIQGMTLAEYIKTMEIGKVKGLVEALVNSFIPKEIPVLTQDDKEQVVQIFAKKISELRKTLSTQNNEVVNQSLELLEKHDWSKLAPSQCHGDMTLENIIIKNDKMYLIDFLDSFYDSWFLDIGTLLQDIQVMWSYRHQEDISMNTVLRLIVFRDLLVNEVRKINEDFVIEIYYSLLQKLIRIYPYAKDELTYSFLNEKTRLVIENIRKLEMTRGGA